MLHRERADQVQRRAAVLAVERAPDRLAVDRDLPGSAGIGLPLARSLIEADGGRLLMSDPDRAEFRIVFAAPRERRP